VSQQGISTILLIKAAAYNTLNPCSKFCLNSCRDVSGSLSESDCGTEKMPEDWKSYRGLAYGVGCATPSCVCLGGGFNISYGKLYQASVKFCNTLPTTKNLDSPEYDRLQGVLADYCTDNGMTPYGYINVIEGDADNSQMLHPGMSVLILRSRGGT
jgi:hypothetical protein